MSQDAGTQRREDRCGTTEDGGQRDGRGPTAAPMSAYGPNRAKQSQFRRGRAGRTPWGSSLVSRPFLSPLCETKPIPARGKATACAVRKKGYDEFDGHNHSAKQSQFAPDAQKWLTPGERCAWVQRAKQSQFGEESQVRSGKWEVGESRGDPSASSHFRLHTGDCGGAAAQNKANFHRDADPEIGVPGGQRAKQSQFPPQGEQEQVLYGKRVMMNWARGSVRQNKANSWRGRAGRGLGTQRPAVLPSTLWPLALPGPNVQNKANPGEGGRSRAGRPTYEELIVRNKANFQRYADPEIGVPGGKRAKQSQFPPVGPTRQVRKLRRMPATP